MTTCDRYQAWMVEALYAELAGARRTEFDAHVAACADCAALYAELRSTADLMNRRRRPEPGPEFWDGYWRRLEERVARDDDDTVVVDASRFARRRSLGSWGYRVAAVVALLAAGAWLGRTVLAPSETGTPVLATTPADSTPQDRTDPTPIANGVDPKVAQEDLKSVPAPIDTPHEEVARAEVGAGESDAVPASSDDEAQRYIERSQLLLLTMLNGDPADSLAFDAQRQRAGELVRVASSVRENSDDRRVQELVAQLELILREIAHLEQSTDIEAVELIRSRVDREGVLLRINVEQMRSTTPRASNGAID